MRFLKSLLALTGAVCLVVACALEIGQTNTQVYLDRFYDAAVENDLHLPPPPQIKIANILGICGSAGITLDNQDWLKLTDTQREALLFHELGHCVLSLGHIEGRPHIMNSVLISEDYYRENRGQLINDLFQEVQ